jgi:hypothetical protein
MKTTRKERTQLPITGLMAPRENSISHVPKGASISAVPNSWLLEPMKPTFLFSLVQAEFLIPVTSFIIQVF